MRFKKCNNPIVLDGKTIRNGSVLKLRSLFHAGDLTGAINFLESLGFTDDNLVSFILACVGGAL